MKKLLAILILSLSTTACNASTTTPTTTPTITVPETKPVEEVVEKKEIEKKKVCIKVWDAKLNKEVEKCRTMKIHEKKEGTNVPTK